MNPNQALWEKGDFTRIAATMRESRRGGRRGARHQAMDQLLLFTTAARGLRQPDDVGD